MLDTNHQTGPLAAPAAVVQHHCPHLHSNRLLPPALTPQKIPMLAAFHQASKSSLKLEAPGQEHRNQTLSHFSLEPELDPQPAHTVTQELGGALTGDVLAGPPGNFKQLNPAGRAGQDLHFYQMTSPCPRTIRLRELTSVLPGKVHLHCKLL